MTIQPHHYILTISCPDKAGLVANIAQFLSDNGAFIVESGQFGDADAQRFFMRLVFTLKQGAESLETISQKFTAMVAAPYQMEFGFYCPSQKTKAIIMVSKFGHCLNDLLFRCATGALEMDVAAVISNHTLHENLAQWRNIPYHHIPVTAENKAKAEADIAQIVENSNAELIILARYMQVLSPNLSQKYAGRIINIHHSFLPSFKGAEPYSQAHARGVKIIGATAHYVTSELDEGPIIEQRVERVDHNRSVPDLIALGRDLEAITLARAVQAHIQHRIFVNGKKTVVFS